MFEMSLFAYLLQPDITEQQYSNLGSARLTQAVHASIIEINSEYNAIYKSFLHDWAWMGLVLTKSNNHLKCRLFLTLYLPSAGANRNLGRQIGTQEANWNKANFSFI